MNERTTTTRPDLGENIAWLVVSGAITAVGVGIAAAAPHQNHEVVCGDGYDAPQAGDTCESSSDLYMEAGLGLVAVGLGLAVVPAIAVGQKPKTTKEPLPPDEVTTTIADSPCGAPEALEGMSLALELPNGGRWSGKLEHGGSFHIEIDPEISLPEGDARICVDDVPPGAADIVARGTPLGTLSLAPTAPHHAGRRAAR